ITTLHSRPPGVVPCCCPASSGVSLPARVSCDVANESAAASSSLMRTPRKPTPKTSINATSASVSIASETSVSTRVNPRSLRRGGLGTDMDFGSPRQRVDPDGGGAVRVPQDDGATAGAAIREKVDLTQLCLAGRKRGDDPRRQGPACRRSVGPKLSGGF